MPNSDKAILVLGATGRQGGAAARALTRGFPVRGLTRDPDKPAARALTALGATVVKGDLDDASSVQRAMEHAHGVFSVQTAIGPGGAEREEREGIAVAVAAKRAGVQHLVYSSVGGAERKTGIAHFDSKFRIEEHVRAAGMRATVLRPVFFMDNFAGQMGPRQVGGELVLRMALAPTTRLQMIAVRDIGVFAALAFDGHEGVAGRATEIAGDDFAMTEIAGAFAAAAGRPVRYEQQPLAELQAFNPEFARMFRWFEESGYKADIAALKRVNPSLTTFRSWLSLGSWKPAEA